MLEQSPQIIIIPIDNRPVCYDLPLQAAEINNSVKIFAPDISLLGDLNHAANLNAINAWTKYTIKDNDINYAIVALDTIAYGGLIPSRRTVASFNEIKFNIDKFLNIFKKSNKKIKLIGISSIMRISNNNYNEEEKSYWDSYGKDLFRYSFLSHKLLTNYDLELEAELIKLAKKIPFEVIDDYLNTRKRNFDINNYYIDLVKDGIIDKIVFSQDDTAEYGFNVEEKDLLLKQSKKELVSPKVTIKNGADEMVMSLLSNVLIDFYGEDIKIAPEFFKNTGKDIISRYEDTTIENSALETIKLCGGKSATANNADLNLIINTPNKIQDDICLGILEDTEDKTQAAEIIKYLSSTSEKYIIADVKNANGADNNLVNDFLNIPYNSDLMYGYAAWNTTGNTLGTAIAIGIIKYLSQKHNSYNEDAFKKTQYTRFMDDWAYQANVRKIVRDKGNTSSIDTEMYPYSDKISQWLDFSQKTLYSFPWDRTFEIKIDFIR